MAWQSLGTFSPNYYFCGSVNLTTFSYFHRIFELRKIVGNREKCKELVPKDYPVFIDKVPLPHFNLIEFLFSLKS